jgi:hypothetical protein
MCIRDSSGDDVPSGGGEVLRDGQPDAATGAGDEN